MSQLANDDFFILYTEAFAADAINQQSCQIDGPNKSIVTIDLGDSCQIKQFDDGSHIILSGYLFYISIDELHTILSSDLAKLSTVHGHFCGVYFPKNQQPIAFGDRLGARTLYFKTTEKGLVCSTNIASIIDVNTTPLSEKAISESLLYRTLSHDHSMYQDVKQLPYYHYAKLSTTDSIFSRYWNYPKHTQKKINKTPELTLSVKNKLKEQLEQLSQKYNEVAVPLSGGVDSFLLANLAKEHFNEVIAYTPMWTNGENPELGTAKKFAKLLNIEHQLVNIEESDIEPELMAFLHFQKVPLRHYSSLVLNLLLKAIPENQKLILYGDAADTLFGCRETKRVFQDNMWQKIASLIPNSLLQALSKVTSKTNSLIKLRNTNLRELALSLITLEHKGKALDYVKKQAKKPSSDYWQHIFEDNDNSILTTQKLITHSELRHSSKEIEVAARRYHKHIVTPFDCPEFYEISSKLSKSASFGSTFSAYLPDSFYKGKQATKPIIRDIACEYSPRELIYETKYGFPVPMIAWLKGPLKHHVDNLYKTDNALEDYQKTPLSIEQDYQLLWTLVNLSLLKHG